MTPCNLQTCAKCNKSRVVTIAGNQYLLPFMFVDVYTSWREKEVSPGIVRVFHDGYKLLLCDKCRSQAMPVIEKQNLRASREVLT